MYDIIQEGRLDASAVTRRAKGLLAHSSS